MNWRLRTRDRSQSGMRAPCLICITEPSINRQPATTAPRYPRRIAGARACSRPGHDSGQVYSGEVSGNFVATPSFKFMPATAP